MKTILMLIASFITCTTFAQKDKAKTAASKPPMTIMSNYHCPMHYNEVSDHPGKCAKCGMDLTLSKKEQMKRDVTKLYTCPMHTEVVSNSAGKCPVCHGSLTLSKKEVMKMQVMKLYTCPMHGDVATKNPGKCPKCGMELTKE